jgi:hypothetical protein
MRPQSVADGTILWYCRGENSAATREPIAILIALILGLAYEEIDPVSTPALNDVDSHSKAMRLLLNGTSPITI